MTGQKKKLGVDIDGVIVDQIPSILCIIKSRFNVIATRADIVDYSFAKSLALPDGSDAEIVSEYNLNYLENANPIDGAIHEINGLKDDFDLHFVTSRPLSSQRRTESWMQVNGLSGFPISYVRHQEKAHFLLTSGFDAAIEDAADIALDAVTLGLPMFLLEAPWNSGTTHPLIKSSASWQGLVPMIRYLLL